MSTMPTVASNVQFPSVCALFEQVQRSKDPLKKRKALADQLTQWRTQFEDLYPLLRLLVPRKDARQTYNVKHKSLADHYIKFLGLDDKSAEAKVLKDWKKAELSALTVTAPKDFPDLLYDVLQARSTSTTSSLSVGHVNDQLDRLKNDTKQIQQVLQFFYANGTPLEQKWIVRIILDELKLGIAPDTILTLYHPDAAHRYLTCSDLKRICDECKDQNQRLEKMEIPYFYPCATMHLKRALPNDVLKLIKTRPVWMEEKLDGWRLFLHYRDGEFRYFTRNGSDLSEIAGMTKDVGFSKRIYPLLQRQAPKVHSMILDGELMVYEPMTDRYKPFGQQLGALKTQDEDSARDALPCFLVFDVLMVNDTCITGQPLARRREFLENLIHQERGTMQILPYREAQSAADIYQYLEQVMMNKGEGICIKDPDSTYIPGERGNHWLKIKPDFISELGEHFDVVIIGAGYGVTRNVHRLAAFICAVKSSTDPGKWIAFARFGTGFNDKELEEITQRLQPYLKPVNPNERTPDWLIMKETGPSRDKFDMIIDHPSHSFLVEIKATEIIPTTAFPTNWTVRFPRFVKIRDDKSVDECLDMEGLLKMQRESQGRTVTLLRADGQSTAVPVMQAPRNTCRLMERLPQHLQSADVRGIQKTGSLFEGLEVCVMSGGLDVGVNDKKSLETLIVQNGGTKTHSYVPTNTLVIVAKPFINSNAVKDKVDVINYSWVLDCIAAHQRLPFEHKHIFSVVGASLEDKRRRMDCYGDVYTRYVSKRDLRALMATLPQVRASVTTIKEMEKRYQMYPSSRFAILRPCVCYLEEAYEDELQVVRELLLLYGAEIASTLTMGQVSHVIVRRRVQDRRRFPANVKVVPSDWVMHCIRERSMLPETPYLV